MLEHHVHPKKFYVFTFLSLIVLTAVTTGVAFIDLGYFNTVVALVIAVCKATLVVLFFMHLKEQTGLTRIVILVALLWLTVLIGITASDVFTRRWLPSNGSWERSAVAQPR
ncbi:MAG TPA: cytochrome C oxidase subunit IV family protein [Terriglobia bacterium]|nr:cytochrome C oxidase subunit IV family protein [Terriglobia bacterium]